MRAAVWTAPDTIETAAAARAGNPRWLGAGPDGNDRTVRLDFSILHGTHPRAEAPLVMGHEITGVVEVAAETGPAAGTRVTVEPLIHCGECHPCSGGDTHVCRALKLYGIDVAGSLAEYVALPASALIPVSNAVPLQEAALAEPLAVAVHAVSRAGLTGGERVVIFGAGPDRHPDGAGGTASGRRQRPDFGTVRGPRQVAEELASPRWPPGRTRSRPSWRPPAGDGADIVFDSAAHPSVAAMLPRAVRVRGTIVLVGVYKKPVELDLQALTFAENTVVGRPGLHQGGRGTAVELIESRELGLDRIPTQVFALEDASAAFEQAMASGRVLKVFVSPAAAPAARTPGKLMNHTQLEIAL